MGFPLPVGDHEDGKKRCTHRTKPTGRKEVNIHEFLALQNQTLASKDNVKGITDTIATKDNVKRLLQRFTTEIPRPKRAIGCKGRKMRYHGQKTPSGQRLWELFLGAIRNGLFYHPKELKNHSGHSRDYWCQPD